MEFNKLIRIHTKNYCIILYILAYFSPHIPEYKYEGLT